MAKRRNQFDIVRLSITLRDTNPKVTRRMDVPVDTDLRELHSYIQAAMGWYNCHLWEFIARRYEQIACWSNDFRESDAVSGKNLRDVIHFLQGKPEFIYLYDFGDSWEHKIRIGKIQPARDDRQYPYLVSGAGRCPLEDIGGVSGYYQFLRAFEEPDSIYREYYPEYFNGKQTWDPEDADLEARRSSLADYWE